MPRSRRVRRRGGLGAGITEPAQKLAPRASLHARWNRVETADAEVAAFARLDQMGRPTTTQNVSHARAREAEGETKARGAGDVGLGDYHRFTPLAAEFLARGTEAFPSPAEYHHEYLRVEARKAD